jgi:hypothetical protein
MTAPEITSQFCRATGRVASAQRATAAFPTAPVGSSTTEATVLAPVFTIVSAVFAPVASTPNAACNDRGRAGHGGGPRNRSPA